MRYAVISDLHGNLPALRAVVDDLLVQGLDATICLGDVVGYYADSPAVVALLAELIEPRPCVRDGLPAALPLWVAGNHEWGLLGRLSERLFSPVALHTLRRTRHDLSPPLRAALAALPLALVADLGDGVTATLAHATPADPVGASGAGYIENAEDAHAAAAGFATTLCLVGHTHCPRACAETPGSLFGGSGWQVFDLHEDLVAGAFFQFGAGRQILNPGSVGQPRDGDPRAAYAILDTAALSFDIRRVVYDVEAARWRLRRWLDEGAATPGEIERLGERLGWGG